MTKATDNKILMREDSFFDYQLVAGRTAVYPDRKDPNWRGLEYVALGACGEAGEIANKVKKIFRDDGGKLTVERRDAILHEVGGCLWYLSQICEELNAELKDVAMENLGILDERKKRGTLHGDGDNR